MELVVVYDYIMLASFRSFYVPQVTYAVAAAVDMKPGGHGNGTTEEEDGVESVKDNHQERMTLECLLDRRRNEVEQGEHAENSNEHVIVDERWVASVGRCDHVTDNGHDQKRPDEL